jgi:hypothetical protein
MRVEASRELLASRSDVWALLAEPYHLSDWWPGIHVARPDRRGLAPAWRPEVLGRPRRLPRDALNGLHALCQTAASF